MRRITGFALLMDKAWFREKRHIPKQRERARYDGTCRHGAIHPVLCNKCKYTQPVFCVIKD
jgi:hypothetical protein